MEQEYKNQQLQEFHEELDPNYLQNQQYDQINQQYNLKKYGKLTISQREINLRNKLKLCGQWAKVEFRCKKCQASGGDSLLKVIRKQFFCEIRYCSHTECIVERFARQVEDFKSIKRMTGLNKLWHFAIGFPPITREEFQNNFPKIKKRFETVMGRFFKKLRDKGIVIQGIRVMDFAFTEEDKVYVHFHFGAIPIASHLRRKFMFTLKEVEFKMIKNMQIKTPFHFQSFGYKAKTSIFSYLSKRSVGLYKYDEGKNLDFASGKGRLSKDIDNGVYFMLKDVLSIEQYVKFFYNSRHYATIGGLPHGSILTDNSLSEMPTNCKIHGELERCDIHVEITFDVEDPPPENSANMPQNYPDLVVETIKIV